MISIASMNISLPDPMRAWVESQLESGKYASTSDYVRDLIRKDQEQREKFEALKTAIQEGLESGVSDRTMEEIWNDFEQRHGS